MGDDNGIGAYRWCILRVFLYCGTRHVLLNLGHQSHRMDLILEPRQCARVR